MQPQRRYLTDDRDLPEEKQRELIISQGGNGDWYVSVDLPGAGGIHGVRICTSGGAASRCPGLGQAIAQAYRAMGGEGSPYFTKGQPGPGPIEQQYDQVPSPDIPAIFETLAKFALRWNKSDPLAAALEVNRAKGIEGTSVGAEILLRLVEHWQEVFAKWPWPCPTDELVKHLKRERDKLVAREQMIAALAKNLGL